MATWYTNSQAPFFVNGKKVLEIPPNSLVENSGKYFIYRNITGTIDQIRVEPYIENYPKNVVDVSDIETPDPNDAAQYVMWEKYKQTNMCGEMSVCYVLSQKEQRSVPLSEMLAMWKIKNIAFWKRVFSSPKARGTYPAELVEMFSVYGYKAKELSKDKNLFPLGRYTPFHLSLVQNPIVSVKIDGNTGRLRGQGVGHWVVVTNVELERTGYGFVEIYNSFPNRIEKYSYAEFIGSAGTYPYGAVLETL